VWAPRPAPPPRSHHQGASCLDVDPLRRRSRSRWPCSWRPAAAAVTTGPTQPASSSSSGRTVRAPAAKGELDGFTWALPFEATSLDPIKSWSYPENTILANLCESVVHLTPALELEPGLASKVDTSDPNRVVLTVRDGVRFWDGSVMTAEDVACSLNRNLQPELGGLMCTGPFKLERWSPGQSVVIGRSDGVLEPPVAAKGPAGGAARRGRPGRVDERAAHRRDRRHVLHPGGRDRPAAGKRGRHPVPGGVDPHPDGRPAAGRAPRGMSASARRCRWRWTGR
jgi:hypothetical protein